MPASMLLTSGLGVRGEGKGAGGPDLDLASWVEQNQAPKFELTKPCAATERACATAAVAGEALAEHALAVLNSASRACARPGT